MKLRQIAIIVCTGMLILDVHVLTGSIQPGNESQLAAQTRSKQIITKKIANPFKYEYISGSLGGFKSRLEKDSLYYGDSIKCSVINTGDVDGVVLIEIHATQGSTSRVVHKSNVSRLNPQALLFLEYIIPSDWPLDSYWVKIKVSNEFLIPRAKSSKVTPESQRRGDIVKTIADYKVGDFAVFSSEPYKRIW